MPGTKFSHITSFACLANDAELNASQSSLDHPINWQPPMSWLRFHWHLV